MTLVLPCLFRSLYYQWIILFLLFEQPLHETRIIKCRIPAAMIATGEFDIFHLCSSSFSALYASRDPSTVTTSSASPWNIRNFTSLATGKRSGFTDPQMGTAAAKSPDNGPPNHTSPSLPSTIRQYISVFIDFGHGQISIQQLFESPGKRTHLLSCRHICRKQWFRTFRISPVATCRTLRNKYESRIFLSVDRIQKHLSAMRQLSFIVISTLTGSMQEQDQRIFLPAFIDSGRIIR